MVRNKHSSIISDPGFYQVMSMWSEHMITDFAFNMRFTITTMEKRTGLNPSNQFSLEFDQKLKEDLVQETRELLGQEALVLFAQENQSVIVISLFMSTLTALQRSKPHAAMLDSGSSGTFWQ